VIFQKFCLPSAIVGPFSLISSWPGREEIAIPHIGSLCHRCRDGRGGEAIDEGVKLARK
jgi:hypothetical protein